MIFNGGKEQSYRSECLAVGDLSGRTKEPDRASPRYFASIAIASIAGKAAFERLMDELYA